MQRLRSTEKMRELVAETHLDVSDLILPVFFNESISKPTSTTSMPGILTHPLADYEKISSEIQRNDLNSVILFGIPSKKDSAGSQAYVEDGVVQKAIKGLKKSSDLLIITDLCLCEYTDHGHCGVLHNGSIDNDETISLYARTAVSQADAGADIIAPSGMMDGQVAAIREALDDAGHKNVAIMAYSAKFQSSFYGPFRDLARSSP
ncbi:MAG: porphobilinogen synthase, partial [Candidatus Methanomethylophilaceae archaeon]